MTTVAANECSMAGDTLISYSPSFEGRPKIWVAKHSLWGAAGPAHICAAFKLWTLGKAKKPTAGQKPEGSDEEENVKLEVLQLHRKDGLFLWVNNDLPEKIVNQFYAIGSGGACALGALAMGATPELAVAVAARFDNSTREPINILTLDDIPRSVRKSGGR